MSKHADVMLHNGEHRGKLLRYVSDAHVRVNQCMAVYRTLFIVLLFSSKITLTHGQNCTVNAGGAQVVCGTSTVLKGSIGGATGSGNATWSFVSGPATPVIDSPSAFETKVEGMVKDGKYTFQLSYPCSQGTSTSTVEITAHPRPDVFTAGADQINTCAVSGMAALSGVIPQGFSGVWRTVNIFSYNRFGTTISVNSALSNPSIATPTLSLINKSSHEIDPAYWAILKITSNDGLCSYEDTTIVRFAPNPEIKTPATVSRCLLNGSEAFFDLTSAPYFSTAVPGSAGTMQNGVSIVLNVISQPPGAALAFNRLETGRVYLSGMNGIGNYVFTLTVTSACGTYTTPQIAYNFQGFSPHLVNFQPPGHSDPEQLVVYASGGSGGEVHCGIANTNTPETFFFSIHPEDPPGTMTSVSSSGIVPGGTAPTLTVSGEGTMSRVVTVTPPAGGWQIGTYRFTVVTANASGGCRIAQFYYIHVSDNKRVDVVVNNATICREGNNPASATIQLPAVYKSVVDASYFQDFSGYYNFTLKSKPAGAADPLYQTSNLRALTSSNTIISNFTAPGEYIFEIKPFNGAGVGPFLEQEYACAGKSITGTFSVYVEDKVNSNAGSDQASTCPGKISLRGDDPGTGTGTWTLVSAPPGSAPTIVAKNAPATQVSGVNVSGVYVFRWTIVSASGFCTSDDDVSYTVTNKPTLGSVTQPTCGSPAGSIQIINLPSGNWTISRAGASSAVFSGSGNRYTDTGLAPGTYTYTVTSEDGCTSDPSDSSEILAATSCTPPTANPVHFVLISKPVVNQVLVLNGISGNPTAPNGQDKEDGLLGGTLTTSTLVVTSLPDNGVLFYDGTAVTAGQVVPNFDASRLTIKLTGSGYSSTTFYYAFIDQSGLRSTAAPYTIEWQSPLPVTLVDFKAIREQNIVMLDWVTSMEKNSDYFEIQHSVNAKSWNSVSRTKSQGEGMKISRYAAFHRFPCDGINYYRLKMTDRDGTFDYSPVRSVQMYNVPNSIIAYPNPAFEKIAVKGISDEKIFRIELFTMTGIKVMDLNSYANDWIDVSILSNGMYLMKISLDNGFVDLSKIQIQK